MKKVKQRKMLMALPLLILPFLTLGFYALGGGNTSQSIQDKAGGLNIELPDPNFKDESLMDKLSFYDKARKDSIKMVEWMRSDPYYTDTETEKDLSNENSLLKSSVGLKYNQHLKTSPFENKQTKPEEKVLRQLSLLQNQINEPIAPTDQYNKSTDPATESLTQEVNRLETMMNMMQKGNNEDPEIQKLESTLDKILDIQHPERVKERMKDKVTDGSSNSFSISLRAVDDTIVNGFYGIEDKISFKESNAIKAVIHEDQVLVNGAVIKLRLLQDIFINHHKITAGNFVYGIVSLNGERLQIQISSIRQENNLFDIKMEVHDMDGLPGIYIPGNITRDVAKQTTNNNLQLMELSTMDPSLKAQAASAGMNAAKSLLSKKVKLVKVKIKAGYKVLLKDKSNN